MADYSDDAVLPAGEEIEYIPGSCNIGPREIRRRQLVGGIGLFLTISTIFGFSNQHSSHLARFGVFLPALIMSIGYLQGRKKFCLAFGLSGLFNLENLGTPIVLSQNQIARWIARLQYDCYRRPLVWPHSLPLLSFYFQLVASKPVTGLPFGNSR